MLHSLFINIFELKTYECINVTRGTQNNTKTPSEDEYQICIQCITPVTINTFPLKPRRSSDSSKIWGKGEIKQVIFTTEAAAV